METDSTRKMLLLHHFVAGNEIYCDPDAITSMERMDELPVGPKTGQTEEIPARTRIYIAGAPRNPGAEHAEILFVKELPGEIAAQAGWPAMLAVVTPESGDPPKSVTG